MSKQHSKIKIIVIIIVLLLVAAAACGALFVLHKKQTGTQAQAVLAQMQQMIPGLGESGDGSSGLGRDPLAALSIDGVDVVGCLEIPALDLMVPVINQGLELDSFVTWAGGSPVQGHFRLSGNKTDALLKLPKVDPGDTVTFTDIDGVKYQYQVTTQFNVKNWDEPDYDFMIGYDIDGDTQFVVACTAI